MRWRPVVRNCLIIAVGGCTTSQSGTIFRPVPWPPAVIPHYNIDSVTSDSASNRLYALVGTVVDSSSGRPLEATQILLRQSPNGRVYYGYADSHGGFVLGRVVP